MRPRLAPMKAIQFAAKMGFITKDIWRNHLGSGKYSWNQEQWAELTKRGYFVPHPYPYARDVLIFNPLLKGTPLFERLTPVKHPYAWQIVHDEVLAKIIIEIKKSMMVSKWMCEAELERDGALEFCLKKESKQLKYPDAIIELKTANQNFRIALEVERTRKSLKRYRSTAFAYSDKSNISLIIFICENVATIDTISGVFQQVRFPLSKQPVGFGLISEWIKNPKQAVLVINKQKTSLENILAKLDRKLAS